MNRKRAEETATKCVYSIGSLWVVALYMTVFSSMCFYFSHILQWLHVGFVIGKIHAPPPHRKKNVSSCPE